MTDQSEKPAWRSMTAATVAAAALLYLPPGVHRVLCAGISDALLPGQRAAVWISHAASRHTDLQTEVAPSSSEHGSARIRELELLLRKQQLSLAIANQRLAEVQRVGPAPYAATESSPLIVRELLVARVLGREKELTGFPSLLLDLGSASGDLTDAFVLRGGDPVIDQGTRSGVAAGQPVYAGRCVVGRVARSGRWTAVVQPITDSGYTGRAQLVRTVDERTHFGAEGLLSGLGDGTCKLSGIPYTEPVSVGDEVYTGGRTARFPVPMYYGRVAVAELVAGQRWNIIVRPAAGAADVTEVAVLREASRDMRVLGQ